MAVSRPLLSPRARQPRDEPRPAVGGAGRPENERRGERSRGGSSAVPSIRFRSGLDPVPFPPESFSRVASFRPRPSNAVPTPSRGLCRSRVRPGVPGGPGPSCPPPLVPPGRAPCRAATPHATSVSCSPQRPPPRGSARTPLSGLHPRLPAGRRRRPPGRPWLPPVRQAPRSLPALPGRALSLLASASTRRRWRPCAPACRLRARWRGCPGRWRPHPQCLARAVLCDMRETNENERFANTHNAYASQIIKRLRTTF